jgi:hypothetical protein
VVTRSLSPISHRALFIRAALGLAGLAAASLVAGCASLGPSVRQADDASVDLAHQQIRTSDLQIMNGLFISAAQLGSGWAQSSLVDAHTSGEDGLNTCGVGVTQNGMLDEQQYEYSSGSQWIVNQVLVYSNATDAGNALSSIGSTTTAKSCTSTDEVGDVEDSGTNTISFVVNGTSVEPNWFNPVAGLIAPATGQPGVKVVAQPGASAVIAQARGPFVSIVYGPADADSSNVPEDASAMTLTAATLAYQQLNQLTDADVGTGS